MEGPLLKVLILVTDGSTYLDLVEIGKVNKTFHFTYVTGEDINTVWQGILCTINLFNTPENNCFHHDFAQVAIATFLNNV